MKRRYHLLLYKKIGKHKLFMRFSSYWKLSEYCSKRIPADELKNYYYIKTRNIR